MKIHLDKISAVNLSVVGNPAVIVRILVGDAEMVTERGVYMNNTISFPDIYEFNLDDIAFATGLLELEVEVLNVSNPQDPILLGEGTKILRHLFPRFDATTSLIIGLSLNSNIIRGEVKLQGIITEHETLLDELKLKFYELDGFRKAHEGKLSGASESDMKRALMQVEKANKKNVVLQQKFNEMQEKYMMLKNEHEKLSTQNNQEMHTKLKSAEDTAKMLKSRNDELLNRISEANRELAQANSALEQVTRDKIRSEKDLNSLQYDFERRLQMGIQELKEENLLLGKELDDMKKAMSTNGNSNKELLDEIKLLKASRTIQFQSRITNPDEPDSISPSTKDKQQVNSIIPNYFLRRISDLTDRFQVGVRTRPPTEQELAAGSLVVENYTNGQVNVFNPSENMWSVHSVDYHWCYDSAQNEVFQDLSHLFQTVIPSPFDICAAAFDRDIVRHVGIILRGGSMSGKTYTAFGGEENPGVAFQVIREVFDKLTTNKILLERELTEEYHHYRDIPSDLIYEFDVHCSAILFNGSKVLNANDTTQHFKTDFSKNLLFDPVACVGTIDGIPMMKITNEREGLSFLRNALKSFGEGSSFAFEILVTVKYQQNASLVKSKVLIVDVAAGEATTNLDSLYESLARSESIPFEQSKLSKYLQPLFYTPNKQVVIFNISPSSIHLELTMAELKLATNIKNVRYLSMNSRPEKDSRELDKQVFFLSSELRESKKKNEMAEKNLKETKRLAEELIKQLNEGSKLMLQRYTEERDLAKQLKHDLALTQRNLKKAIAEGQEQRKINERLVRLVKGLEDERNSLNALIAEN